MSLNGAELEKSPLASEIRQHSLAHLLQFYLRNKRDEHHQQTPAAEEDISSSSQDALGFLEAAGAPARVTPSA